MSEADNELTRSNPERSGSSDNSRTWLLVIGIVAVLAIAAGSVPRSASGADLNLTGVDAISIESNLARLIIKQDGSRQQVFAELTGLSGTGVQLESDRRGDQLYLSVERRFWQFRLFSFRQPTLTVTFPAGYSGTLQATGSSNRMDLDEVNLAELTLRTSSGTIHVADSTVSGDATVQSSSGSVRVHDTRLGGSFTGTTSSGRLELDDVTAASYLLRSSSGRIQATGLSGGPVEATASSGLVHLEADELLGDWQLRSSSGQVNVELDRLPRDVSIDFQGNSGGWQVAERFNLADSSSRRNRLLIEGSGPRLEVRTSSGDFRLN